MRKTTVTTNRKITLLVPRVPNFVQLEDGSWTPLCEISREGLTSLANEWTLALFERAEEQAKDRQRFIKMARKETS